LWTSWCCPLGSSTLPSLDDRERSPSYTLCCHGPLTLAQSASQSAGAFAAFFYITLSFATLHFLLNVAEWMLDPNDYLEPEPATGWVESSATMAAVDFTRRILSIVYGMFVLRVLLRRAVRAKYGTWGSNVDD
jgi:hypothetical protein